MRSATVMRYPPEAKATAHWGLDVTRAVSNLVAVLQGLNWNAHHLDSHIEEAMRLTRVVSDTLATVKGNIGRIEDALRRLLKGPMFERKEGKVR